jgi:hypothetical protein
MDMKLESEFSKTDQSGEECMVIRNLHPLRWWISLAVVLLIVAIGTPIGVNIWYTNQAVQANSVTRQIAEVNRESALSSCLAGNEARATNVRVWDAFLTILIQNPQTAKTRESVEAMITALDLPANVQQGLDDIIIANWTDNPADVKTVQSFEAYIAAREPAQPCTKLYGNPN